jgi:hypothetical protein
MDIAWAYNKSMDQQAIPPIIKKRKNTKSREDKGTHRDHKNLQKEFELYALFLALTIKEKVDRFNFYTDEGFAKKYRIAPSTLSAWKKDSKLWEERDKSLVALKQYTTQVLEGVRNRAMSPQGRSADANLWLRYVEKWNPKTELSADIELTGGEMDFG